MLTKLIVWNRLLWGGPILLLLFATHVSFTLRSRFVQKHTGRALKNLFCPSDEKRHDSVWSALTTTLAATLGTGNIIGMSTAVALGGPGAVFWCWLTGVFGMATTYAECNLSLQHAREPGGEKGPMHLLRTVLHKPLLARLFAAAVTLVALVVSATLQSNALASSAHTLVRLPNIAAGIVSALLMALVLFGAARGIERVCSVLVPAMSLFFFGGCLLLLLTHLTALPSAAASILRGAFFRGALPSRTVLGGLTGYSVQYALRQGVAKGLFTNEAGLGTATLTAVENTDSTIVDQSLFSMLATFFDTVVLCGLTGLMLVACLESEPQAFLGAADGDLVSVAFASLPLLGEAMLHVSIITFAFATLLGWCFLGEKAADDLAGAAVKKVYRFTYLLMIVIGSVMNQSLIWELTDFFNLFLLLPNLYLLFCLRRQVIYPSAENGLSPRSDPPRSVPEAAQADAARKESTRPFPRR